MNETIIHHTNLQRCTRDAKALPALSPHLLQTSHTLTRAPHNGVITGSPTAKQSPRCPLTPDIINGAPFDGTQLKMHQHPPIPLVDAGGGARGCTPPREARGGSSKTKDASWALGSALCSALLSFFPSTRRWMFEEHLAVPLGLLASDQ